ncbi:MAG: hypothetical protein WC738_06355 [Candidatus Omnitrophota bacterium]|jgi:hypothetical protein
MKAIVVLAIVAFVSISVMPLVSADTCKDKPDTVFQRASDTIGEPISVEVKPLKKVEDFQKMSDGIKIGSQEAKMQTLRKTKTTDK